MKIIKNNFVGIQLEENEVEAIVAVRTLINDIITEMSDNECTKLFYKTYDCSEPLSFERLEELYNNLTYIQYTNGIGTDKVKVI